VLRLVASRLDNWESQKDEILFSIKPKEEEKGTKQSIKKVGKGREGGGMTREFEEEAR
jgi:hypothetical protein